MTYRDPDVLRALSHTLTDRQIAARYGVSDSSVRQYRHRYGIGRSPASLTGNVRYEIAADFFHSIDTPEKAYVLGFIVADGSVNPNGNHVAIEISERDEEILDKIRAALGSTAPIRHRAYSATSFATSHPQVAILTLCRQEIVRDLARLGVGVNKTQHAIYPAIPRDLDAHFVRGLYDGDGSIGTKNFFLIGTKAVIDGVRRVAFDHTRCTLTPFEQDNSWCLRGSPRDRAFLDWIYSNATIYLQRKYDRWQEFWHRPPYIVSEPLPFVTDDGQALGC